MLVKILGRNGGNFLEINEIPHEDRLFSLEDDMSCLRLSSENDTACKQVQHVITTLFGKFRWIYKFVSFADDLDSAKTFCQKETTRFYKGNTKCKFFTLAYPELHAEISNADDLLELFCNCWSSVIYQTHVLYIVSAENEGNVFSILENELYKDTDSISSVWPNVKIVIRNQPEAEYHNTFLIFFHNQYLESIMRVLNLQL